MKKLLLFFAIAFVFSACNKCKECTDGDPWTVGGYSGISEQETYGDQITEVCSDNFESKKDFNDFIDSLEDDGYDCKSDFWN
ncbi:MAG: hypothetical protein CMD16_01465 [Flavobacteriales bacterium]|nr:hypothetical protein [Flavobacteriales bacterium]|tara:strand:+ start:9831 stop:10076 length:246 start_codon:yes stop_codon:yes gene_type:complete